MKKETYIELIHVSESDIQSGRQTGSREWRRLARAIRKVKLLGHKVNYRPNGGFDDEIPVDRNHPIVIGGAEWRLCPQKRANELRKKGYKNVHTNHKLSYDPHRNSRRKR